MHVVIATVYIFFCSYDLPVCHYFSKAILLSRLSFHVFVKDSNFEMSFIVYAWLTDDLIINILWASYYDR
jgi:hypothetical protein